MTLYCHRRRSIASVQSRVLLSLRKTMLGVLAIHLLSSLMTFHCFRTRPDAVLKAEDSVLVSPVMMFYCFRTGHDAVLNTEDSAGCAGDPGSSRKARSKILKGRHSISCELPRLNQNDPCYVVTHDVLPFPCRIRCGSQCGRQCWVCW